ncbi:uncharacterized protein LOC132695516 [Cylas formicarius]|uniref:uncharacterized protein LOC132695516 n=1 Tax=Cylas formicarius TaxID=197179 RepID=UPI0029585198|nr:uncharacterized protein LOC132695516 [Cylas formicarius]
MSWNKIVYIDKDALDGIKGLRYLNLSRNSLMTVPMSNFPSSLTNLNLSYNLLDRMLLNSNRFSNLTVLDFSYNFISKVAISYSYPLQEVDLTNNNLRAFDFVDVVFVELLKIASNKFVNVPEHLLYLNARKLDIYPNPWKCDELRNAWRHFYRNGVNVINKSNLKYCVETNQHLYDQADKSKLDCYRCSEDSDCPTWMACRGGSCWNPCEDRHLCDASSICYASNHTFECNCPANQLRNPMDIYSQCDRVECYDQSNCNADQVCSNNKCSEGIISHSHPLQPASPIEPSEEKEEPWWFEEIPKVQPQFDGSPKANISMSIH